MALPSLVRPFVSRELGNRHAALDAFRGLMILGMILVNHPPPTKAIYAPLVHAPWHGWTLADTIFPGFLFAVGVSVFLSMGGAVTLGAYAKIARRFLLLLLLNFALVNFPYYLAGTSLHFSGTLATIAWCYLAAALCHLYLPRRGIVVMAALALALQWLLYAALPVPGAAHGTMTVDTNAAAYVDQLLFGGVFDSVGSEESRLVVLPTLGAVASTLLGLFAGAWVRGEPDVARRAAGMFTAGLVLLLFGAAWDAWLPINKSLWTGSYVCFMGGVSLQMLAALYWLMDGRTLHWTRPLQVAGANALLLYVLAQGLQRALVYGRLRADDGTTVRLRQFLYENYLMPFMPGPGGSLLFALGFVAICYAVAHVLYHKRIFVKL